MTAIAAMTAPDWIGLVGVALYLGAYAALTTGRVTARDGGYYAMNAAGSAMMIYSLVFRFNVAAFISSSLWLVFTLVGWVRARRVR